MAGKQTPRRSPISGFRAFASLVADRRLRVVLPALLVSSIGTGMTVVAFSWIAIDNARILPPGALVALALAATVLPGLLGSLIASRPGFRLSARAMVITDSVWRGTWWIVIGVWTQLGAFHDIVYLVMLALASVTTPWYRGGVQGLVAQLVDPDQRLEANAWLMSQGALASMIGPALGGLLAAVAGAHTVLVIDGLTFGVVAVALSALVRAPVTPIAGGPGRAGAWATLRAVPVLLPLLVVTFAMALFFGLFEVALPLHVERGLAGGPGLLGALWTCFGVGAFVGSFLSSLHRRLTIWQSAWGTCMLWGAALLIIGAGTSAVAALAGVLLAGLVYAPYAAVSATYLQNNVELSRLPAIGALWAAWMGIAAPLGYLLGGSAVTVSSGRSTILVSAAGSLLVGLTAAALSRLSAARAAPEHSPAAAGTAG